MAQIGCVYISLSCCLSTTLSTWPTFDLSGFIQIKCFGCASTDRCGLFGISLKKRAPTYLLYIGQHGVKPMLSPNSAVEADDSTQEALLKRATEQALHETAKAAPDYLLATHPAWMCRNYPFWVANNYPEVLTQHWPLWLATFRPEEI